MPYAFCTIHKVKYNKLEAVSCPLCFEEKRGAKPHLYKKTGIQAKTRKEYFKEYRKYGLEKIRAYNKDWMRRFRNKI